MPDGDEDMQLMDPAEAAAIDQKAATQPPKEPVRPTRDPNRKAPTNPDEITDEDRADFLDKLDSEVKIDLSDFESNFLENLKKFGYRLRSDKQRAGVDKMIAKYRDRLKW